VTVAVCYSLQGSGDPREKFAEMYASGPNEPPHPLRDASDAGILSAAARNCSTTPVIGAVPSHGLTRFATAGWRSIKSGIGGLLGVKTAYGVDLGLGGFVNAFSNIGPALSANISAVGPTEITRTGGGNFQAYVRLSGSSHHDGEHQNSTGLAGLPVHFQLTEATSGGALAQIGDELGGALQLDATTNDIAIDPESPVSGGGYAAVNWTLPQNAGTYHLSVDGAALGGPVVFTVTVTSSIDQLRAQAFQDFATAYRGNGVAHPADGGISDSEGQITYSALLGDEFSFAETFPTRIVIDQRSMVADNLSIKGVFRDLQRARASLDFATEQSASAGAAAPSAIDLIALSAFADILAAENWCSGVPTSQLTPAGTMVYGFQQTTPSILSVASAKFDTVMSVAAAAGDATLLNLARMGKARALVDLNDIDAAVTYSFQVPTDFVYSIDADGTIPARNNGVFVMQNFQRRWTVSNNEGGNGLPYLTDADPRVPFVANGFGFDGTTPMFMQLKYGTRANSTPLASGVEARLIEAEFRLRQGDAAQMTNVINSVRVPAGLPAIPTPPPNAARATLFKERAYALWLTSHRLGDLRREIRQYGVTQDQVFPTGPYPKGGVYGADVNFPIPVDAQFNPTGLACLDRNP
jgi:hypothetical protein